MALTKNFRRIGMASHIEKRAIRDYIQAEQVKERVRKAEANLQAEAEAMDDCIALEGAVSFFAWYDNDENVPDHGLSVERRHQIEDRIERLKRFDQIAPSVHEENNHIHDWLTSNWDSFAEIPL